MFDDLLSSSFLDWSEIPINFVECEKPWWAIYNFSGCDKNTSISSEVEVPKSEVEEPGYSEAQRSLRPSPNCATFALRPSPKLTSNPIIKKTKSSIQNRTQSSNARSWSFQSLILASETDLKTWCQRLPRIVMLSKAGRNPRFDPSLRTLRITLIC